VIDFVFEDVASFEFKEDIVEIWIEQCVEKESKISGDICFIFCNDTYLLKLNQEYLKHDYFTDVITFDYSDDIIVSGDIFISVDRIADNAKQFGVSFDYELLRVIIHGVLHLCGYKDKSKKDKIQMTSKEDGYLKELRNVEGV
jgi:rRNA maturation RNase YbeY